MVLDRPAGGGMKQVRRDGSERFQDESAIEHTGVGDGEVWLLKDGVAEQQDVEIDGARSVADGSDAAEGTFDIEQDREQGTGVERGVDGDDLVQERRLVEVADRGGFVHRGLLHDFQTSALQGCDCSPESGLAVADVGPEAEVGDGAL